MAWYYILFLFASIFFIVKFMITLIFGDIDFDVDVDGDVDFDVSSLFSFKGILHFLLGFSSYLTLIAKFNNIPLNENYTFDFWHYLIGIGIGLIFMIGLFYLYKFMGKLNHYNLNNIDVNGYTCTILINNGLVENNTEDPSTDKLYSYTILINTEGGSQKINVLSTKENLPIGSSHKVYKNVQGIYYI